MIRWLKRLAALLVVLALAFTLLAWWLLRGSLPQLDGQVVLGDLSAPVTIQRDALGVITIDAANETDAMRALGYVHAQERFFEMDLMRRTAAGELSELFGPIALETDKKHRMHRMREIAKGDYGLQSSADLPRLTAYTNGVNIGLGELDTRPWPYLLLRLKPKLWQLEDSALVGYAMYFDLQDEDNSREIALARMRPHVPSALFALLTRDGSAWDAPLFGQARNDATLPPASQLDLRRLPPPVGTRPASLQPRGTPGSNNFAVAGALTRDGRAIVADDMHLGLRAPNIWFRARLRFANPDAPGGKVDVQGFTLPGLPAVIVGSNGHVAWGYTNSYIDTVDRFGGAGWLGRRFDKELCAKSKRASSVEYIKVKGESPYALQVNRDPPESAEAHDCVSLRWIAHMPRALTFDLARLAFAGSVDQALQKPIRGLPAQNMLIADNAGHIAWTLVGAVPQREEPCDPYGVHTMDDIAMARGPLGPDKSAGLVHIGREIHVAPRRAPNGCLGRLGGSPPMLRDPPTHRLWTANNRTLDGEALQKVGDGGYALGARAKQIRDDLFAKDRFTERDLLAIQLDDRAVFLERWWKLLVHQAAMSRTPALAALSDVARDWTGRASTGSVSYRVVRAWRLAVHARIADGLTAPAQAALGKDFVMPDLPQLEGVVWPLLRQRPQHLLSRRYDSWDALLEDAAKEVHDELAAQGPLSARTWGERNTADICHPLANAIPLVGRRMLCMPADQLSGDTAMPRVQGPRFGASERMVVSPGHEEDGIVHMPGGQSGHFLSPFWGAGHDDWVHGRPTPFLPGKTEYRLRLTP